MLPAHRYLERRGDPPSQSASNWAFDIDGVISAFPGQMGSLMSALVAAGFHVWVITGVTGDTVTPEDVEAKREFLTNLGVGPDLYHELLVLPDPHPENKARAIEENHIQVLVDNAKGNIKAAAAVGAVGLLLWNNREK